MKCQKISRWVLRHGADNVPPRWRDHIADCERCQKLTSHIDAMDQALSQGDVPDPGDAYWEGLAPSVARRIDANTMSKRRPIPVPGRFAWVRPWAPAVTAGVLAFLIGRELTMDSSIPTPMDSDLVVSTERSPNVASEADGRIVGVAVDPTAKDGVIRTQPDREKKATLTTPTEQTDEIAEVEGSLSGGMSTAAQWGERPSGQVPGEDAAGSADEQPARHDTPIASQGFTTPEPVDDSEVWPDRRVTIMGEVNADTPQQPMEDQRGVTEPGSSAFADKMYNFGAAGAETVGVLPPQARLEAPRTYHAAGTPDNESPAEAMRRFDEQDDLRRQIAITEAIPSEKRTTEQTQRLCAMWYRLGMITPDSQVLDTAIQRLNHCLDAIEPGESENWRNKSAQLSNRLRSLQQ